MLGADFGLGFSVQRVSLGEDETGRPPYHIDVLPGFWSGNKVRNPAY